MALSGPSLTFRERNTVLAIDTPRTVTAATSVWAGGAVGEGASGTVRPVSADTYPFQGIAMSDAVAGEIVTVRRGFGWQGRVLLAGTTEANIGDKVYATADDTYTFTALGGTPVGKMAAVDTEDADYIWVDFTGDTWS
jgi:hypothetical protein